MYTCIRTGGNRFQLARGITKHFRFSHGISTTIIDRLLHSCRWPIWRSKSTSHLVILQLTKLRCSKMLLEVISKKMWWIPETKTNNGPVLVIFYVNPFLFQWSWGRRRRRNTDRLRLWRKWNHGQECLTFQLSFSSFIISSQWDILGTEKLAEKVCSACCL